jgi:hypothetical protein
VLHIYLCNIYGVVLLGVGVVIVVVLEAGWSYDSGWVLFVKLSWSSATLAVWISQTCLSRRGTGGYHSLYVTAKKIIIHTHNREVILVIVEAATIKERLLVLEDEATLDTALGFVV